MANDNFTKFSELWYILILNISLIYLTRGPSPFRTFSPIYFPLPSYPNFSISLFCLFFLFSYAFKIIIKKSGLQPSLIQAWNNLLWPLYFPIHNSVNFLRNQFEIYVTIGVTKLTLTSILIPLKRSLESVTYILFDFNPLPFRLISFQCVLTINIDICCSFLSRYCFTTSACTIL